MRVDHLLRQPVTFVRQRHPRDSLVARTVAACVETAVKVGARGMRKAAVTVRAGGAGSLLPALARE